jgi:hypothetical protein
MDTYKIKLLASKAGSIGTKYNIVRHYTIEAIDQKEAEDRARELAYAEGLEHTLIVSPRD